MAKMGRLQPQFEVKKSDLNKAIANKNEYLQTKNTSLEKDNASIQSDIKEAQAKFGALLKDLKSQEGYGLKRIQKLETQAIVESEKVDSAAQSLKDYNKKIGKAKDSCLKLQLEEAKASDSISKLDKKAIVLSEKVASLEIQKDKHSNIKEYIKSANSELKAINADIQGLNAKKGEVEGRISSLDKEYDLKVDLYKGKVEALEEEHSDLSVKSEKMSDIIDALQADLGIKRAQHSVSVTGYDEEIKGLYLLIGEKEDECFKLESTVKELRAEVEVEKSRIEKIKEDFRNWKVNALEDIARLKLKGKIETIDKAGLGEILNG